MRRWRRFFQTKVAPDMRPGPVADRTQADPNLVHSGQGRYAYISVLEDSTNATLNRCWQVATRGGRGRSGADHPCWTDGSCAVSGSARRDIDAGPRHVSHRHGRHDAVHVYERYRRYLQLLWRVRGGVATAADPVRANLAGRSSGCCRHDDPD